MQWEKTGRGDAARWFGLKAFGGGLTNIDIPRNC